MTSGSRVRLGAGLAVLLATSIAARHRRVGPGEAEAFRAINSLPDALHPPAWAVMQLGALGAVPAAAGVAWLAGDRRLAGRLLSSGTVTWALAKLVKQLVRRPRPATLLPGARSRGRQATGLGYLSGHAGVAAALTAAALPRLGPGGRAAAFCAAGLVGLTRVYTGAHLPLDVVGGAALGVSVDAALASPAARHEAISGRKPFAAATAAGLSPGVVCRGGRRGPGALPRIPGVTARRR
jgi:glycosyltransferase 2 family protein